MTQMKLLQPRGIQGARCRIVERRTAPVGVRVIDVEILAQMMV